MITETTHMMRITGIQGAKHWHAKKKAVEELQIQIRFPILEKDQEWGPIEGKSTIRVGFEKLLHDRQ